MQNLGAGITLDVKVEPQVKAWLMAKNGDLPIVKFRDGDTLIKVIHNLLAKRQRKSRKIINPTDYIKIYIPKCSKKYIYSNCHLSEDSQKMINDYLKSAFKTEFIKHMIDKIEEGYEQKDAIIDFLDYYHLKEDVIKYETLKKSWDRSQEKAIYYKNATKHIILLLYVTPLFLDLSHLL